jgi:peptide/nickel transport system substrate-binding protein
METSPFVMLFQETDVWALRKNVNGYVIGPSFDMNLIGQTTKN